MKCSVNKLENFLSKNSLSFIEVTPADIENWIKHSRKKGLRDTSICKNLCHVRSFYSYLENTGVIENNPAKNISIVVSKEVKKPNFLSSQEIRELINAFSDKCRTEYRDKTVVVLFYATGLRANELIKLNVSDIDFERGMLFIREGKRNRQRYISIPGNALTRLDEYIKKQRYRKGRQPALFTRRDSQRLSASMLRTIIREAAKRADLQKRITPLTLRHTYATHMLQEGVPITVLGKLMGHSTLRETSAYIHVIRPRVNEAIKQHPCDEFFLED